MSDHNYPPRYHVPNWEPTIRNRRGLSRSFSYLVPQIGPRLFPVAAVIGRDHQRRELHPVQAAYIDVDLVRVRPRHIERMHAAGATEGVSRDAGPEGVGR